MLLPTSASTKGQDEEAASKLEWFAHNTRKDTAYISASNTEDLAMEVSESVHPKEEWRKVQKSTGTLLSALSLHGWVGGRGEQTAVQLAVSNAEPTIKDVFMAI